MKKWKMCLKIGDTIEVKITEIDKQGRVNASHSIENAIFKVI